MKILILHRVPFAFIKYDKIIDHQKHQVIYLGKKDRLADLPTKLPCQTIILTEPDTFLSYVQANKHDFFGIDRVVSASQYELRNAALIREFIGASGMSSYEFDLVDDKVLMKANIKKHQLRIPNFMSLNDFRIHPENWNGKTVVKPLRESASRNVEIFPSPAIARANLNESYLSVRGLSSENVQVEEYVEGPIYHFDGYALNGKVALIQPSAYSGTCLDYAKGETLGSFQFNDKTKANIAATYVLASGIHDGVFHLEMIESNGELVFLEIAPRVGGGGVCDTFQQKWGIDLVSVDIAIQAGIFDPIKFTVIPVDECFGYIEDPGHLHSGKRCKVNYKIMPECIIKYMSFPENEVLGPEITYNEDEVPLYFMFKIPIDKKQDQIFRELKNNFNIQYF